MELLYMSTWHNEQVNEYKYPRKVELEASLHQLAEKMLLLEARGQSWFLESLLRI